MLQIFRHIKSNTLCLTRVTHNSRFDLKNLIMAFEFRIELELGNVGFWGEGKTGVFGEKPLGARTRTNNKCRRVNVKVMSHTPTRSRFTKSWQYNFWHNIVTLKLVTAQLKVYFINRTVLIYRYDWIEMVLKGRGREIYHKTASWF